jgi:amidophosphoribosyltransferase
MSTIGELFAPKFMADSELTAEVQDRMAETLGADSLRYLPVEAIARAVGFDRDQLCQACITGDYPTAAGQELYQVALNNVRENVERRTYETLER